MTPVPASDLAPTVSSVVADVVAARADHLFGLMGNGNAHLISHLTSAGFGFTSARHEASTVTMADGYHRATGRVGAATTTYGAGFTNSLTALAEAKMARIPLVLIVGDAPTSGMRPFDIDQGTAATAVGVRTLFATPGDAQETANRAFDLAVQTVQPVVLAIPYDCSTAPVTSPAAGDHPRWPPLEPKTRWDAAAKDLERIAALLTQAKRPMILAGRGVLLGAAQRQAKELGDRLGAMFMTSVMATNIIESPWNLGIAGGFTRRHQLEQARRADVVLLAGASWNSFQSRYGTLFSADAHIIRIDNEPEEVAAQPQTTEYLRADLASALQGLTDRVPLPTSSETWRAASPEIARASTPSSHPVEAHEEFGADGRLNPRAVMSALDAILPRERSVVMDGGHFIGWAPMYLSAPDPHAMILVGTAFQSIGLGFGSASGVSVARPERTTVLVTGDGGGLMGLADLETFIRATRHGVIVVLNDSAYGAELHQYASKGLDPAAMLIDEVDFAAVGRAFGATSQKMHTLADLEALKVWLGSGQEGVFVLDVAVSQKVIADFMTASLSAGKKM